MIQHSTFNINKMGNSENIKEFIKEKYSTIAVQSDETMEDNCGCSGCGCGSGVDVDFSEDYTKLEGYHPFADLGLGCGLPTESAKLSKGDVVVDLGSGAGNDCFVAVQEVGTEGKVVGIDMTETMIGKAQKNAEMLGLKNVEFKFGEIEKLPLEDNFANVVISNCVLNLVPDKEKAFAETYRILKPSGHFSISDVVIKGEMPKGMKHDAEMYAGCVAGAVKKDEYLDIIEKAGFQNITIQAEKKIELPDAMLRYYLKNEEIAEYYNSGFGIFSVTVYAEKA